MAAPGRAVPSVWGALAPCDDADHGSPGRIPVRGGYELSPFM